MSNAFEIREGKKQSREITPQGAKNEALQILCAVLLTEDEVRISNIPDIKDVNKLIEILQDFNVKVTKNGKGDYTFKADEVNFDYIKSKEFKKDGAKLRGSVMILGPMLARFGEAYLPTPGGDKIGRRRLDTHFQGFVELGAEFSYDEEEAFYSLRAKELKGKFILLEEVSVTGTANIVMAAVLAKGKTRTLPSTTMQNVEQNGCQYFRNRIQPIDCRRRLQITWHRTHNVTRYGGNWLLDWLGSNDKI